MSEQKHFEGYTARLALRVEPSLLAQAQRLAELMSRPGARRKVTDICREALELGLERLWRDLGRQGSPPEPRRAVRVDALALARENLAVAKASLQRGFRRRCERDLAEVLKRYIAEAKVAGETTTVAALQKELAGLGGTP